MRKGQAMVEYVVVLAALIVVSFVLCSLNGVISKYSVRSEKLVASEYP
ncbi:MAG: hypothetical protein J6R63_03515 [Kiritimatiellae bacterium]|jgi:hypothetical protein|nr:hypothetical protein [Kiritimatiellia bacterium]